MAVCFSWPGTTATTSDSACNEEIAWSKREALALVIQKNKPWAFRVFKDPTTF